LWATSRFMSSGMSLPPAPVPGVSVPSHGGVLAQPTTDNNLGSSSVAVRPVPRSYCHGDRPTSGKPHPHRVMIATGPVPPSDRHGTRPASSCRPCRQPPIPLAPAAGSPYASPHPVWLPRQEPPSEAMEPDKRPGEGDCQPEHEGQDGRRNGPLSHSPRMGQVTLPSHHPQEMNRFGPDDEPGRL
jgi:hypothetical protein